MLVVVDIGNTKIKTAVFEGSILLEQHHFQLESLPKELNYILEKYPKITDLVISSVVYNNKSFFSTIKNDIKVHFLDYNSNYPFQNLYATPETLGMDRMVLVSGAVLQYPNQNRLIIDCGTCITFDFVDSSNKYYGGAISPGIRLRYESLHHFTSKLPLHTVTDFEEPSPPFLALKTTGSTTKQSIHSGVINGLICELEGCISQYESKYPNFIIILTGGDADFLAKRLKNTIFANSNFLLESLNQLFQYNSKND
jgi:type III pantothenate kinase